METKRLEKEFRIEVIASLLENRLLNLEDSIYNVTEDELYDLCSYISGEDINMYNFYKIGQKIKNILLELHPELNIRINYTKNDLLYNVDINSILTRYKNTFGNTYIVKSLKKSLVKTLKIQ